MNQNKTYYLIRYGLGLLFLFSYFFLAYIDFYEIRPDPQWSYLPIFRGEAPITDWHSSLFMYEGRILTKFLYMAGVGDPGFRALRLFWFISEIAIFFSIYTWIKKLSEYKSIYFLLFPLCSLSFLILADQTYCRFRFSIDLYFTAFLFVSITLPLFFYRIKFCKKSNVFISVLYIFLFLHIANYRKNAILLIPFLAAYVIAWRCPQLPTNKVIHSFFISVVFLLPLYATNHLLPARRSHPPIPMLASDLKIAAILQRQEAENLAIMGQNGIDLRDGVNGVGIIGGLYSVRGVQFGKKGDVQWNEFKKYYLSSLATNPLSMGTAKVIQIVQFFSNGYVPHFLRRLIHYYFHSCPPDSSRWDWKSDVPYDRSGITPERIIVYFFTCVSLILSYRAWRRKGPSLPLVMSLITGVVALVYILSFLPVTPTPDFRYHSPSMLLGGFSILCTALYYISSRSRKVSE